jgi:hypothetical protein
MSPGNGGEDAGEGEPNNEDASIDDPSGDAGVSPGQDASSRSDARPSTPDSGIAIQCGALSSPDISNTCCTRCTNNCQQNGCFGGRWCSAEPMMCYCVVAPDLCTAPSGPGSSGGPLTCAAPGDYDRMNTTNMCGAYRWGIKTATDSSYDQINLAPRVTTIADLVRISAPSTIPFTRRVSPVENTVYEIRNVTLSYVRLSDDDSDEHLVINDVDRNTMIVEAPLPDCVPSGGSTLMHCAMTRARAAIDHEFTGQISTTAIFPNVPVTVVGVGFFDEVHAQHGVAPNGIELHPVLAICFGLDCNPYAQ